MRTFISSLLISAGKEQSVDVRSSRGLVLGWWLSAHDFISECLCSAFIRSVKEQTYTEKTDLHPVQAVRFQSQVTAETGWTAWQE